MSRITLKYGCHRGVAPHGGIKVHLFNLEEGWVIFGVLARMSHSYHTSIASSLFRAKPSHFWDVIQDYRK